jgi:protein SCO1/2
VASGWSRRRWLATPLALAAAWAVPAGGASAHAMAGRVEPSLAPPRFKLSMADGSLQPLHTLLQGRVTALQLMFTGCRSSCPIQGAQFQRLQQLLAARPVAPGGARRPSVQLLSVSIDALGDDPPRLRRWLQQWPAQDFWRAGVAQAREVDAWFDFLGGRSTNPQDAHTAQVYLFDARGRLAWRSADWPTPDGVATTLAELQARPTNLG